MSEHLFLEKNYPPSETQISDALGDNNNQLEAIRSFIHLTVGETREVCKYYGKKYGWPLKTFLKKRNLFFAVIYDGYFNVAFVFGDKAVNVIADSNVSNELVEELPDAKNYAEGRGLRIKVEGELP